MSLASETPSFRTVGRDPRAASRVGAASRRAPGRPALMTPEAVLQRIRDLARRDDGLFRIHERHSALYARARRMFGSWRAAVATAGIDYAEIVMAARRRSLRTRRQRVPRAGRGLHLAE